jgi:hypothetical protein
LISSSTNKTLVLVGGLILLLIVTVAAISNFWPQSEEKFIEIGLLGKDKKAEGYFVNDYPSLNIGNQVNWYLYLHNQMTNSQFIQVKVKLLNSTMKAANDISHQPSPVASVVEIPELLNVNSTQLIPFTWSIDSAIPQDGSIVIKSITVNGQTIDVEIPAVTNSSFNIVFELWVYDQSSQTYQFGWESGKGFHSASVSMWFNLS